MTSRSQRNARSGAAKLCRQRQRARQRFPDSEPAVRRFSAGAGQQPRVGVAIGDQILDVAAAADRLRAGWPPKRRRKPARRRTLNHADGARAAGLVGAAARFVARARAPTAATRGLRRHLTPMAQAELLLPVAIGDFTDFYASVFHATNAGRAFRPDNPLLPNYKYVPVAYHGRGSSIRVSGTPVKRPQGQRKPPDRGGAELRSVAQHGFRARARHVYRHADRARRHRAGRQGGRAHFRLLPAQRLVGARRAGLGIPAARAVPRQEFRHHGFALGGDAGSAGAVPHRGLRAAGRAIRRRCRISPMPTTARTAASTSRSKPISRPTPCGAPACAP